MSRILLVCLVLMPAVAQAAPVFHFGTAPFTPAYLEDFEDGKLDIPGVTATSGYLDRPGGPLVEVWDGVFGPTAVWAQFSIPPVLRTGLRLDFDQPVTAVGFMLTSYPADFLVFRVLEADGTKTPFSKARSELTVPSFIGIESVVGISAIQLTSHTYDSDVQPIFQIDDLRVVPEPSALALSVVAVVFLVARRKR